MAAAQVVAELIAAGLTGEALIAACRRIDEAEASVSKASPGALRQRRWRERKASQSVSKASRETFSHVESNGKGVPDKERSPIPSKEINPSQNLDRENARGDLQIEDLAFRAWNNLAIKLHLPQAKALSEDRRRALRARLKDAGGLTGWYTALEKLAASSFCRGERSRFRADLDFVLQAKSFRRLMEGRYDDHEPPPDDNTSSAVIRHAREFGDLLRRNGIH